MVYWLDPQRGGGEQDEMIMDGMTMARAAAACGAVICGEGDRDRALGRMVIDSRAIEPGDLFAAYQGERVDGHDYIAAAFDKGAACCLAERIPAGETRPILLVDDVQAALEAIAADYRSTLSIPVIGITGSVGKTSAKEMIASVLSQRYRVLKTEGNLNNQIGVPMTISRITKEHEIAVVEMGISGFGEMTHLAAIAQPTVAVYTVIGHAHLEFLHDLDGVLRAKTEMLAHMPDDAPVLMNGDDEKQRDFVCRQKKTLDGLGEGCDLRAVDVQPLGESGTALRVVGLGREFRAVIPALGKHLIYAALEGAAVGIQFGLSDEEIAAGIAAFRVVGRRAAAVETGKLTLIDDCYNANPDSTRFGIDTLLSLPGRHVAVLGDMLELGEGSARMHHEIGRYAREQGVELLLCAGPYSRECARAFGEGGTWYESREALIEALPQQLREGDRVLVKASLGMHFDKVAEAVKAL